MARNPEPTQASEDLLAIQRMHTVDTDLSCVVAERVLRNRFRWSPGAHWRHWDGTRWADSNEAVPVEHIRAWLLGLLSEAARLASISAERADIVKRLTTLQSAGRIGSIVKLCRGISGIYTDDASYDAFPLLLNTPTGVVDLMTGDIAEHPRPDLLMTRITRGNYRSGFTHPDWAKALESLPAPEREWFQARIGQAITGHPTPDGIMPVLQGSGENGKSLLTTDGLVPALGDYGSLASAKLVAANRGGEHSTEMADLRGKRLLIAEEMTEGRALDVTMIKRIQDVGRIRARAVYRDNMEFDASHSLFVTTNYVPVVNETDHGTWRRLALLRFPYTFRKPGEPLDRPTDRAGDPGLKSRLRRGGEGQHDAAVTWAVEGALRVARDGPTALAVTPTITADTLAWRGTADRILAYWSERLVADPAAMISAADLLDDFGGWLITNGHRAWSRETFGPRFAEHFLSQRHGVAQRRTRDVAGIARRPATSPGWTMPQSAPATAPSQPWVWSGVRWRTPADDTAGSAAVA
ncbi:phage/plasmid primase, P4 family [Pseudonocardia sp.]|uniref:DNA primase family protein n=1 Tax=Pseudonocardia sp. TaxID=60912 RepID=UPI00260919D4|nr:phage/plasmid primase, P4 family [Pseudonocardia sp.]